MSRIGPWRYPGGKVALSDKILPILDSVWGDELWGGYIEPFVGGGGFTLTALSSGRVPDGARVLLNDADPRVAAWWECVALDSDSEFERMCEMLVSYEPTVASFFKLRAEALKSARLADRAFAVIATNKCSYSGLLGGGPIGGKKQASKWPVGVYYHGDKLARQHRTVRALLQRFDVSVSSVDFRRALRLAMAERWQRSPAIYLDPPYVKAGGRLYPTTFTEDDHADLASLVHSWPETVRWAISYDDHPWVHSAFKEREIRSVGAYYSITQGDRHYTRELVVTR